MSTKNLTELKSRFLSLCSGSLRTGPVSCFFGLLVEFSSLELWHWVPVSYLAISCGLCPVSVICCISCLKGIFLYLYQQKQFVFFSCLIPLNQPKKHFLLLRDYVITLSPHGKSRITHILKTHILISAKFPKPCKGTYSKTLRMQVFTSMGWEGIILPSIATNH